MTNEGRQSQNTIVMRWSLYYADDIFRPSYWAIFRSNLRSRKLYSVFFTNKVSSLQLQWDLVVLWYSLVR